MMAAMPFFDARRVRHVAVAALSLAMSAMPRAQEATWYLRGSEANVRLVGPTTAMLRGEARAPISTPAGAWMVHFATDAAGKPGSLELDVPEAAIVGIAIGTAGPVASRTLPIGDPAWVSHHGGNQLQASWEARCIGSPDERDYRVVATASGVGKGGGLGVVARWTDAEHHYRFVWDRQRAELRIERQLGGDVLMLARAPSPSVDERRHELALQVQGFCVQGFCDDVLVAQVFDGAFANGSAGTWVMGDAAQFVAFAIEPPAPPRASSALVATTAGASFVAATGAPAGHFYIVELALDRPHPLVPLTESGSEPWLLQRLAAPRVVLGDWRGSLGARTLGLVPRNGLVRAELAWPATTALRRQAVLVRALVVSPDGDAVVSRTPAVALWM